ncbi:thymidine kinase [bacterium]|nr:thymidine kinase [bacterium]
MATMCFRYGAVSSAKTLNLLAVAHKYRQQGKKVLLLKPELDDRYGKDIIRARAGLEAPADVIVPAVGKLNLPNLDDVVCILVDEAQFLNPAVVDNLYDIAHACTYAPYNRVGVPVMCYGLRTDFRRQLFPATQRLMALADTIEEIETICTYCLKKAVFNMKLRDGQAVLDGPSVEIGGNDKYAPVCGSCYISHFSRRPVSQVVKHNLK